MEPANRSLREPRYDSPIDCDTQDRERAHRIRASQRARVYLVLGRGRSGERNGDKDQLQGVV